jgi:hypothetical protein
MNHKVLCGCRPGTFGLSSDEEYEKTEIFMPYLKQFIEHVKPSVDLPLSSWTMTTVIVIKKEGQWFGFHLMLRTAFNCLMCLFFRAITQRSVTISWR